MRFKPDYHGRKGTALWLVGVAVSDIYGSKLPSNRQVLSFFFYNHFVQQKTVSESVHLTLAKIFTFWGKARLPCSDKSVCVKKVKKLYNEYLRVKKNRGRGGGVQQQYENDFKASLDDLFDIAQSTALSNPKVLQEDKEFLIAQREKWRRGYMAQEDTALTRQEQKTKKRHLSAVAYHEREKRKLQPPSPEKMSVDTGTAAATEDDDLDVDYEPPMKKDNNTGTRQRLITPEIVLF